MTQEWSSHSGSRWEPVSSPAPYDSPYAVSVVGGSDSPALAGGPNNDRRRRRRGPVMALLVTLLTLETTSSGVAYEHITPTPGTSA